MVKLSIHLAGILFSHAAIYRFIHPSLSSSHEQENRTKTKAKQFDDFIRMGRITMKMKEKKMNNKKKGTELKKKRRKHVTLLFLVLAINACRSCSLFYKRKRNDEGKNKKGDKKEEGKRRKTIDRGGEDKTMEER